VASTDSREAAINTYCPFGCSTSRARHSIGPFTDETVSILGSEFGAWVTMVGRVEAWLPDPRAMSTRRSPLLPASAVTTLLGSAGGASNARSAPAAGGASGTVASVSKSIFTMTTSAGQKVTVDETSSTKYDKATTSTSAQAVTKGESVLAVGTTSGTTIKATQVIVDYNPAPSASAAKVIPFKRGAPTPSKQVGQIPVNWSQGSGTIVSGTAANEATEAALAAYPGAVVDRVVKLSDGEYNVHYIGVNWPHHVFETASFKVVGAL
jgi:hypothetical protein